MENYKVAIHRELVFAKFEMLDLYEQRILYSTLSKIEPPELTRIDGKIVILNPIEKLEPIRFTNAELKKLMEKEIKYETLRKMANKITKKNIGIEKEEPNGKKGFDYYNWFSRMSYSGHEGFLEVVINHELYPFLLNMNENYTSVDLKTLFKFNSKYTGRFYYLFETNFFRKSFKITLEELKLLTGTSGMERYSHFKQRVLEPSLNDINKYANYRIEFKEIKVGQANKIIGLEFKINKKVKVNEKIDVSLPIEKIIEELNLTQKGYSYGFVKTLSEKMKLFKNQENLSEELCYLMDYIEQAQGTIHSPEGFIIATINTTIDSNFNSFKKVLESRPHNKSQGKTEIIPTWFNKKEDTPKVEYSPIQYNGKVISTLNIHHLKIMKLLFDLSGMDFLLQKRTDIDMNEVNRINDLYGIDNIFNDNKI